MTKSQTYQSFSDAIWTRHSWTLKRYTCTWSLVEEWIDVDSAMHMTWTTGPFCSDLGLQRRNLENRLTDCPISGEQYMLTRKPYDGEGLEQVLALEKGAATLMHATHKGNNMIFWAALPMRNMKSCLVSAFPLDQLAKNHGLFWFKFNKVWERAGKLPQAAWSIPPLKRSGDVSIHHKGIEGLLYPSLTTDAPVSLLSDTRWLSPSLHLVRKRL